MPSVVSGARAARVVRVLGLVAGAAQVLARLAVVVTPVVGDVVSGARAARVVRMLGLVARAADVDPGGRVVVVASVVVESSIVELVGATWAS